MACNCQPPVIRLATETLFSLAFSPKGVTQYLPLQIKVRTPCYTKMPYADAHCTLLSGVLTWRAVSQGRRHCLGSRRHQTNWSPGGAWNTWPWKTIGHLETSVAFLICEIGVGNFWKKETGGGIESREIGMDLSSRANSRCSKMSFMKETEEGNM